MTLKPNDEVTQNRLRMFLSLLRRHWALLLLFYVIISILYQTVIPFWLNGTWLTHTVKSDFLGCYELGARLPNQIPLVPAPSKDAGRPLTIWMWKSPEVHCGPYPKHVTVGLETDESGIIFLDHESREVAPSFDVTVGAEETSAPRYSLYVYQPLTQNPPHKVPLIITVKTVMGDQEAKELKQISIQSRASATYSKLAEILFGIPTVTLMSAIVAITKLLLDHREKRLQATRDLMERIRRLGETSPPRIGKTCFELYQLIEERRLGDELQKQLQSHREVAIYPYDEWKIWTYELRKQIAARLDLKQNSQEPFDAWLDKMSKGTGFPNDEQREIIKGFHQLAHRSAESQPSGEQPGYEDILRITIQAFQILGLFAEASAVEVTRQRVLTTDTPKDELRQKLQELWYREGKATGRYLLRRLNDPRVNEWLTEWNEKPSPPNPIKPHHRLWPPEIRYHLSENTSKNIKEYRKEYRQDSKSDPIWHWPFGPVKAEDDPRLPPEAPSHDDRPIAGLFWDGHPLWHRIEAPEPGIFVAKPGMGTTTFIWMGRHTRKFWGRKPALSLYLLLNGKPDADCLWHQAEHALGESLLTALTEDPFWLLAAQQEAQEQIVAFLTHWAGSPFAVLRRLGEYGLPAEEQGLLLADVLYNASAHRPYYREDWPYLLEAIRASMEEAAFSRLAPGERFHIFLWVELKSPPAPDGWLRILQEEGFWHLTVPKIFSPDTLPEDHLEVRWDQDNLRGLLGHRLSTCDWGEGEEGLRDFLMALEYPTKDTSTQALTTLGQSTPADLVRAGNELNH